MVERRRELSIIDFFYGGLFQGQIERANAQKNVHYAQILVQNERNLLKILIV